MCKCQDSTLSIAAVAKPDISLLLLTFAQLDVSSLQPLLDLCGTLLGGSCNLLASALEPLLAPSKPCFGCLLHISRALPLVLPLHALEADQILPIVVHDAARAC